MKQKWIPLLTAGMMMTSAMAMPPVQAAEDDAVVDPIIGTLPDWVPQDFVEAIEFYNVHGKSYVADNVICLVRPMWKNLYENDYYETHILGSMTNVNTPAGAQPRVYELEIPEEPDPNDEEALAAYEVFCDKLGVPSDDYSIFENYAKSDMQYVMEVQLYRVLEGLDLSVRWFEGGGSHEQEGSMYTLTEEFSFEDQDGTTVQTDKYRWLPDSPVEFDGFLGKYGRVSVHDNCVVYCAEENGSIGAALTMEQRGEGEIAEAYRSDCNEFSFWHLLTSIDGASYCSAIVYDPVRDGAVDAEWTLGKNWADEPPFDWDHGSFEIKDDCKTVTDVTQGKKGETVFTFIDGDTGTMIEIPENAGFTKETIEPPHAAELYAIDSNPCAIDSLTAYDPHCSYSFDIRTNLGYYDDPEFEVISEEPYRTNVYCRLIWHTIGDVNGDKKFSIADIVLLQKWLFGEPDVVFADWRAADFYQDGQLDARDLTMMKRKLMQIRDTEYVRPDRTPIYGTPFHVIKDGLTMYLGPDESYRAIATIPLGAYLFEYGYQEGNDYWLCTEYEGQYGWIRMYEADNTTMTIYFEVAAAKPVIYLYPEAETDVHIELELTESELSTTYPKYQDGWDVTAYPDGTLVNHADGSKHKYLFWDAKNCRTRFDFSKGFCVAGSDTESFLKDKLSYMGLTEQEMNEFIVYWLPLMEHNAYNLITFQSDAYTNSAKLDITPTPDSLCRIFMAYVPLEEAVEIEPQQLEGFERKGFTVVEWGGAVIQQ